MSADYDYDGPGAPQGKRPEDRTVGEMVFDVSERVSTLVREEIELAKTEVTEKVSSLVRGGVVGIVAGVFALMGLAMLMHGIAWLINELFFEDDVWVGFMIEALFWFLIAAAIAGLPRLPRVPEGRAADPRPRDRGVEADQADPRGRHDSVRGGRARGPRAAPPGGDDS